MRTGYTNIHGEEWKIRLESHTVSQKIHIIFYLEKVPQLRIQCVHLTTFQIDFKL